MPCRQAPGGRCLPTVKHHAGGETVQPNINSKVEIVTDSYRPAGRCSAGYRNIVGKAGMLTNYTRHEI
jgi:hypothetical protein